jgi:hypothetical protein
MYDFRSRLRGEQPAGMGVKCPVLTKTVEIISTRTAMDALKRKAVREGEDGPGNGIYANIRLS